jgi:Undecaprenyl-phosphate glucose phosphotransferase
MDLLADPLSLPASTGAQPVVEANASAARGPMRPAALTPVRQRMSGAAPACRFRQIDMAVLAGSSAAVLALTQAGGVLSTPLGTAAPVAVAAVAAGAALKAAHAYAFSVREGLASHLLKVVAAVLFAALVGAGTAAALGGGAVLLWPWMGICLTALGGAHAAQWASVRRWRRQGRLTPNVVVVGATPTARRLIEAAMASGEVAVLGVFDDRMSRIPDAVHGVPVLGDTLALTTHKLIPYVDRIVITVTPSAQARVRELMERLRVLPNAVTLLMDIEGVEAQRSALTRMAEAPLTQVSGGPDDDGRAGAKRVQDLVLGGLALLAAAPIMVLTALAVRLDSPGPIFFRQRRHGFNNEVINVWKFRSMRHEAADPLAARQVSVDDDRVTRVGRVIRRLSLDELPQIFNVLKGEMSLVGPRPHAIGMKTAGKDATAFVAEYAWRHRMKPGITGWAQINGSVGALETAEQVRRRVAMDVEYIERQSLWLDLVIIARTIPAMIGDKTSVR